MGIGHNPKITYQLTAISLGLILLGGTILGSTPFAFADQDDDRKAKLKAKLKELIQKFKDKIKENKENKCPKKHKYDRICDNKKPIVKITSPEKKEKVDGPTVTITGTASDQLTGIKKVLVKVDNGKFMDASFGGGIWEFTTNLDPGKHKITVKAEDNANNFKRVHVKFTVI